MNGSYQLGMMLSATKTVQLLRLENGFKYYGTAIISLADPRQICHLCGVRNYCSERPDLNHLKFIRSLQEDNHASRYETYSTKVKSLSEDDLLERFRNLQKLGIVNYDSVDSLPLLAKHPFTICNRVEILREAGFQEHMITATSLAKYLTLTKQTIKTLKKHNFILPNVDVMSHILKFVNLEPQFYPEEMLDRSSSILIIRKAILRAFLKRKFDVGPRELKERSQNFTRLWNKSFTTINRNLRLMEDVVALPIETLRRNLYLLALNPVNTETILKEVEVVGDMDVATALKARPKVLCNTCGNLSRILKLLEAHNVPRHFNSAILKVFTLSYDTVKERLEELDKVEFFSIYKSHPRYLELVADQPVAKKRLEVLAEINLAPGSLNTLVAADELFEKYITEGFRQSGMRDIMFFLTNQYGCSANEIRKKLDKHPYWATVSLVEVGRNAKFLSQHLSREEIIECPLVLFYPHGRIEEEFFKLNSREGIECCKENGRVKTKFIAPLLTYFIENESNFSLQGIWSGESSATEATDAPHGFLESRRLR